MTFVWRQWEEDVFVNVNIDRGDVLIWDWSRPPSPPSVRFSASQSHCVAQQTKTRTYFLGPIIDKRLIPNGRGRESYRDRVFGEFGKLAWVRGPRLDTTLAPRSAEIPYHG